MGLRPAILRPAQGGARSRAAAPAAGTGPSSGTTSSAGTQFSSTLGTTFAAGTVALKRLSATTPIFIAGAEGKIAASLIKQLLLQDFKVVAGVRDKEKAEAAVDFFRKYEIISKSALANLSIVEAAEGSAVVPKRARVLVIDGDVVDKAPTDTRLVADALEVAQQTDAKQVLVLSVQGGAGGSTGFFQARPSASSAPNPRLTRTEQLVVDSGLPFVLLRANLSEEELKGAVKVGSGAGSLPASQRISRSKLADVISEVFRTPTSEVGAFLEAGVDTTQSVGEATNVLVAGALQASRDVYQERAKTAPPKQAPARQDAPSAQGTGLGGLLPMGLATISMRKAREAEAPAPASPKVAPRAPAAAPKAAAAKEGEEKPFGTNLFNFLQPRASRSEDSDEEEKPKRSVSAPPSATRKLVVPPKPVAKPVTPAAPRSAPQVAPKEAPKPSGGLFGFLGFGGPVQVDSDSEEEEGPARRPAPPAARKLTPVPSSSAAPRMMSPAPAVKKPAAVVIAPRAPPKAPPPPPPKPAPKPAPVVFKPAPKPAPVVVKPAPKPAPVVVKKPIAIARPAASSVKVVSSPRGSGVPVAPKEDKPKSGGGLFGFLGFSPRDDSDSEDEAPRRPGTSPTKVVAPTPVPVKKPATVVIAPRAAPKPPPPPPSKPAPKPAPVVVKPAPKPVPVVVKKPVTVAPRPTPATVKVVSAPRGSGLNVAPKEDKPKSGGGLFGFLGFSPRDDSDSEDEAPRRPGTGPIKKAAPAPVPVKKPATIVIAPRAAPKPPPPPLPKPAPKPAPVVVKPAPKPAPVVAKSPVTVAPRPSPSTVKVVSAPRGSGLTVAPKEDKPKSGGGLFGFLGFSDAGSDSEDEAPRRPGTGPVKKAAPAPVPVKKPATIVIAPRAAPKPPPPPPPKPAPKPAPVVAKSPVTVVPRPSPSTVKVVSAPRGSGLTVAPKEDKPKSGGGGLFGFLGFSKRDDDSDDEDAPPARRASSAPPPARKPAAPAVEPRTPPASATVKFGSRPGTGTTSGTKGTTVRQPVVATRLAVAPKAAPAPLKTGTTAIRASGFSVAPKAAPAPAKPAAPVRPPTPTKAAPKRPSVEDDDEDKLKKSGGLFGFLFGPAPAKKEEEAPDSRKRPAPAPAPAPAAKRVAVPAKPSPAPAKTSVGVVVGKSGASQSAAVKVATARPGAVQAAAKKESSGGFFGFLLGGSKKDEEPEKGSGRSNARGTSSTSKAGTTPVAKPGTVKVAPRPGTSVKVVSPTPSRPSSSASSGTTRTGGVAFPTRSGAVSKSGTIRK